MNNLGKWPLYVIRLLRRVLVNYDVKIVGTSDPLSIIACMLGKFAHLREPNKPKPKPEQSSCLNFSSTRFLALPGVSIISVNVTAKF